MNVEVLAPLRHACRGCGACCHGNKVMVFPGDERVRIESLAGRMGVAEPVVDNLLRFVDGHCVFLGDDMLCDIHRAHGSAAKPALCQQYPLVVLRTESGVRAGVDPGCFTGIGSWRDGPELEASRAVAGQVVLPAVAVGVERHLLDLLGAEGATVVGCLRALAGSGPGTDLPAGLASRLVTRLQAMALLGMIAESTSGAAIDDALSPIATAAARWDAAAPPAWHLEPEADAWAVHAVRQLLYLRLATHVPNPAAVAVLALAGAVAAAWTDPAPTEFGRTLAAWLRAVRSGRFVRALAPDAQALTALITG